MGRNLKGGGQGVGGTDGDYILPLFDMGPTQISRFAVSGTEIYRVRIGPLGTVDVADVTLSQVLNAGVPEARLIVE